MTDPANTANTPETPTAPDAIAIPRSRLLLTLILSPIITLAATLLAVLALVWDQQPCLAIPAIPIAVLFAAFSLATFRHLTR